MVLRTLGELSLEGSTLTRPKPLSLLAYLSLEGPMPRRQLADVFFADAVDRRDSLATALRHLRRAATIEVLPDERVGAVVDSDAAGVLHQFDAFRYRAVLDAYRGAFLAGVEATAGVELEEWIFETREAIAGRVRTAALQCAREAVHEDRLEDARRWTAAAIHVAGAAEFEADELAFALSLAQRLDLPEHAQLRALAAGYGVPLPRLEARALPPLALEPPSSLHRSTRFVGREAELATLDALLRGSRERLVTVHGVGGMGKTRLLERYVERRGAQTSAQGGETVRLVALEHVDTVGDALRSIATSLGVDGAGAQGVEPVAHAIGTAPLLLALDNVEQVEDLPEAIALLLERCGGLQVLTSSRRRLGLQLERTVELAGLAAGAVAGGRSQAATLFFDRAVRVGFDPESDPAAAAEVEALCVELEGHPLAIELAASMTRVVDVVTLRGLLRVGLDALEDGPIDAPPRHRALRSTLDPSWRLLSSDDRAVLEALSVFSSDFNYAAAAAVAGATLRHLVRLVDHAFLRSVGGGRGRFGLHPVVRLFVRERVDRAQRQRLQAAHERYFLGFVERTSARVAEEPAAALGLLDADALEVVAALRHACERGDTDAFVTTLAALVIDADVLQSRGAGSELMRLTRIGADLAWQAGRYAFTVGLATKLANATRTMEGDVAAAVELYRWALAAAAAAADERRQAMLHAILATQLRSLDDPAWRRHRETAGSLAERSGDALTRAEVLQREAYHAAVDEDWKATREHSERALALAEAALRGPAEGRARAASLVYFSLHNLAVALSRLARETEALALRQRCLAFAEERGQLRWQAYAHQELALAHAEFDQRDQALVHARAARRFYERTRDAQGQQAMERFAREWDLALDDDVQAEQQASR